MSRKQQQFLEVLFVGTRQALKTLIDMGFNLLDALPQPAVQPSAFLVARSTRTGSPSRRER